jgi:asparagine synthase (glutamine-hydrolysing)
MHSVCGRYVLAYNGEIYNHSEIRASLEREGRAPQWRGTSDTEVLLASIAAWGLERALAVAQGMFAIALYDQMTRRLSLARDRLGEKPLYYGRQGRALLFGSEIKALAQHPEWTGEIDREAVAAFIDTGTVPAPQSIFSGIRKVMPGTLVEIEIASGRVTSRNYWSAEAMAREGLATPFTGTATEAAAEIERRLRRSIAGQMLADVPLGAFLSGGVDSSTVVALLQSMSARPVRTFTIGFEFGGYDEAPHARAIARHLGTEHRELYVTEQDALDVIPRLPEIYCEPFADASQIPTVLLSRMARENVTVALTGDGGDELFAGYSRYALARSFWPRLMALPRALRQAAAAAVTGISPMAWDRAAHLPLSLLPARYRPPRVGEQIHKAANVARAGDADELYRALVSRWPNGETPVPGVTLPPRRLAGMGSLVRDMMYRDLTGYLPDDVLVKVDRAAMAVGLETRVPMLDHSLVEFSWRLPDSILSHDGTSKWPLRQILSGYVPANLIERPKMGFGVPIGAWLRGSLRDWAEALLSEQRLSDDGFLDARVVRRAWAAHLSGERNLQYGLWTALMLNAWLDSGAKLGVRRANARASAL